jgi:sugar phosphate isomerase/epimerase
MMVMHISRGDPMKTPNDHGMRSFKELIQEAEKQQVTVAIENTRTVNLMRALLKSFPSDALGLCYDTSHGRLHETESFELMQEFPERIKRFHISDNDGEEDRHWNIGKGTIDWDGFAHRFPQNYEGNLSLEVLPKDESDDEEKFLKNAYLVLEKLDKRITMSR